jgi:hypothetical protein
MEFRSRISDWLTIACPTFRSDRFETSNLVNASSALGRELPFAADQPSGAEYAWA